MLAQLHSSQDSILVGIVPLHAEDGIGIHLRKVDGLGEELTSRMKTYLEENEGSTIESPKTLQ
ncbi:MAG TPA: hypothetical protein IAB26_15615 [Candidatus Limivivens merdigallinarum]|uniref:Uncharacterized protein n=1 Tax=Candidatus Limivivens merdigallinarum TaxID=2840859 RepID=A0A9D0ZYL8_9FIRM|nr:hypothetical protein [Candidatus Limivivens merdigallinarum]